MDGVVSWVKSLTRSNEDRRPLFERKMTESYQQAFNMAYRLTSNRSEAEDLLQETYIRAYRFFHRYNEDLPFVSWLYRIMTNIHIDNVRRTSRLKTVSIDQPVGPSGSAWDLEDQSANCSEQALNGQLDEPFQLGLKAMTPEFRTAIVLVDVEGMSYEEIAEIMHTSVGTVRSRIHRGRKQLREHLERSYPEIVEVNR